MSEKLLNNLPALCNIIKRIAVEAGELTLEYFDDSGYTGADVKGDGSPVTLADQKAEELIEPKLLEILPNVPMIGEESVADGRKTDLAGVEYFWLVDPLDGTKEFISGSGDYTVNIALIHNGVPVLGVIYAPVKGELYAGYVQGDVGKATRWCEDSDVEKEVTVRPVPKEGLTIISSKSHGNNERLEKFLSGFKVNKTAKRGSSLKIAAVAAGKADMYPRLGPTCEWDTAAGDAILRAAGGFLTDLDGKPLSYGGADPKFLNPEFIASSFEWWEEVSD